MRGRVGRFWSLALVVRRAPSDQPSWAQPALALLSKRAFSPLSTDNTAGVYARRGGFSRQRQDLYLLPIVISDGGIPPMSSTNTLTIKVCGCDANGALLSCNAEAYVLNAGLSTGALIAILACIVILLGKGSPRPPVGRAFNQMPILDTRVCLKLHVLYTVVASWDKKEVVSACSRVSGYGAWGASDLTSIRAELGELRDEQNAGITRLLAEHIWGHQQGSG